MISQHAVRIELDRLYGPDAIAKHQNADQNSEAHRRCRAWYCLLLSLSPAEQRAIMRSIGRLMDAVPGIGAGTGLEIVARLGQTMVREERKA